MGEREGLGSSPSVIMAPSPDFWHLSLSAQQNQLLLQAWLCRLNK